MRSEYGNRELKSKDFVQNLADGIDTNIGERGQRYRWSNTKDCNSKSFTVIRQFYF